MKKQIATLFLFFISFLGHSQFSSNDQVFYLDSLKQLTTSENYKYIRVVKDYSLVKELYDALIYYKSGKIEMRSTVVKDNNNLKFEGPCVFYFENGNRRKIVNYSDNKLIGKQFEWFENGNIKSETEIVIGKKKKTETTRILQFWDENNIQKVINGEGEFEEREDENKAIIKGKVKNYFKEERWEGYSQKLKISFNDNYLNGKLISGVSKDSLGVEHHYTQILTKPIPKRGMDNFYTYISKRLQIPFPAQGKIGGKIYLTFKIAADGKIENVKSIYKDEFGISDNAIQLIYSYKEWLPGNYRGVPIKTSFSLPITLKPIR